ncbi:MAG TPA: hypothetical protein VFX61_07130 [Micromonosporaceae bacterium]|nr:hypothetical protein [Micromonosporaceae bacterium]
MAVRRGAVRLAAVLTVLFGMVLGVATPAAADEDRVKLKLPGKFTAGSTGSVNASITKRTDGCVFVRTGLGIYLPGLRPDQVEVQVRIDGDWHRVDVSGSDGMVTSAQIAPSRPRLCKGKEVSLRYRITFSGGAPSGQVSIVAEAQTAEGGLVGRAVGTSRVVGGTGVAPAPGDSPSPTPEPTEEEAEEVEEEVEPTPADSGQPAAKSASDGGGGISGLTLLVMLVGGVMVAMGAALLVVLLRRNRSGGDDPGRGTLLGRGFRGPRPPFPPGPPAGTGGPGGDDATQLLPRLPRGPRY